MGKKLRLTILFSIVFATISQAQILDRKADSLSLAYYRAAEWKQLIAFGEKIIADGGDSPLLRLRVAYANFVRGNYSNALVHYNKVLQSDAYEPTALYYSYLSNLYLNRMEDAAYLAKYLDSAILNSENIHPFKLIAAGAEMGIKFTNVFERGNSSYSRAFLNMRLNYNLSLSTSFSYFNQPVRNDNITQPGYYAKLNYSLFRKINIFGAYHYMRSKLWQRTYENNVGLIGARFAGSHSDLQADFILSQIGDEDTKQYNLKYTRYLTGSLNLYSTSRLSLLNVLEENNLVYQQLIGFKPVHNLWFEGIVTFGNQYNYAEGDAIYYYNGFDKTKFKVGGNCYFLLKQHLLLGLNYTFERKSDNIFKFNYLQHSINGSITWNF